MKIRFLFAAALLAGCQTTGADAEPALPNALVTQLTGSVFMAASLATDVALNAADPDADPVCPAVGADNDDVVLDYGGACLPDSGITDVEIGGLVELTMPSSGGLFVGTSTGLGFLNLPTVGEMSGDVVRSGPLTTSDFEWETLEWTQNGAIRTLSALLRIEVDDSGYTLGAVGGTIEFDTGDPIQFALEDARMAAGGLGDCARPESGSLEFIRGGATASLDFTPEVATSGAIEVTFSDREPEQLAICP